MTNARKSRARRKAGPTLQHPKLLAKLPPLSPQRAMQGEYVAPEGMNNAGLTNSEALALILEMLGGTPVRGELYRVGMVQHWEGHPEGRRVGFIGEYLGMGTDAGIDEQGRTARAEVSFRFAIVNPTLPATADYGTREHPLILWPLDMWHLSPALPEDMQGTMHYAVEGEPEPARVPGKVPVQ